MCSFICLCCSSLSCFVGISRLLGDLLGVLLYIWRIDPQLLISIPDLRLQQFNELMKRFESRTVNKHSYKSQSLFISSAAQTCFLDCSVSQRNPVSESGFCSCCGLLYCRAVNSSSSFINYHSLAWLLLLVSFHFLHHNFVAFTARQIRGWSSPPSSCVLLSLVQMETSLA